MRHFHFDTVDEIRRAAAETGARCVAFLDDPQAIRAALAQRVGVGAITVGNAVAIHPMEGCDGTLDGRPSELTWRRYERFARGGAKLIWFEATAVANEGRANTRQIWLNEETVGDFARLLERIRQLHRETYGASDDLLEPMQLTHSGRYSVPRKIIAYHNTGIDERSHIAPD